MIGWTALLRVTPAQAGTHLATSAGFDLGPCFRRDDSLVIVSTSVLSAAVK